MFKRKKNDETSQTQLKPPVQTEQNTNDFANSQPDEIHQQEAPKVFAPRSLGKPTSPSTQAQPAVPVKSSKDKNKSKEFQPAQSLGVDVTQDMVKELKLPEFDEPQLNKRRRNKIILLSSIGVLLLLSAVIFANLGKQPEEPINPEDKLPDQPPLEVVQPPTEVKPEPEEILVDDPSTVKEGFSPYHNTMLGMHMEYPSFLYTSDQTEYYVNFIRSVVPDGQGYHLPALDYSTVGSSIPLVDFGMRDRASTKIRLSFANSALTSDLVIQPDYDRLSHHIEYPLESFSDEMSVYQSEYLTYLNELDRVTKENENRSTRKLPLPIKPTPPESIVDDTKEADSSKSPDAQQEVSTDNATEEDLIATVDWSTVSEYAPKLFMLQTKGVNEIILQLVRPYESSSLVLTLSYEYGQGTTITTEMLENLVSMLSTVTFDQLDASGKVVSSETENTADTEIEESPSTKGVEGVTTPPADSTTEGGTQ